jgi:hypothetical protein
MFRKQQDEFEKERRQYYSQLEDLRKKTNQAQANYEKLIKDGNATNKALQDSRDAYKHRSIYLLSNKHNCQERENPAV